MKPHKIQRKKLWLIFVLVLLIIPAGLYAEEAGDATASETVSEEASEATIVYSGTHGTCEWTIDSNGLMTISPADGAETGTLESYSVSSDVPWNSYRKSVIKVVVEEGVSTGTGGAEFMFYNFTNMTTCDLTNLDTSEATNMGMMFNGCSSLTDVDFSNFDTSNVVAFSYMFRSCESLESLDLSSFDTSSAKQLDYMFASCYSLTSLDLSSFNTSKCIDMEKMFVNCYALETLDVSSFNTSKVTSFYMMFSGCSSLTYLDMSKFYMSSVSSTQYITNMFEDCTALRTIKISNTFGVDETSPLVEPISYDYGDGRWRNISTGVDYSDATTIPTDTSGIYVAVFETEFGTDEYVPIGGELSVGTLELSTTSYTYNGNARKPSTTVTFAGSTLSKGTDYTVTYDSDRTNVGTYTVTITGKGDYTGSLSTTFTIKAQSLKSANTSLSTTSYTYNGSARKPSVTVLNTSGTKLTKDTDYTVTYASGRKNVGTYKVTITGTGNYKGTVTKTFEIKQKSIASDSSAAKVTLSSTSYTYNGSAKKPSVTLKITLNGSSKKLTKNTDYTVSYKNNTKIGTATVTIKGTGNYKGTLTKTFTIKPKQASISSAKSSSSKKITVKWSKVSGSVTGYQVRYRVKGTSSWTTKTVSSSSLSRTLSSLKSGKKYQIQVRAYKTVSGTKYYGAWSDTKTVTCK